MTSSSLVSEILLASGNLEKDELKSQFQNCTKRIDDIKFEVANLVKSCYSEIHSVYCDADTLSMKLKEYAAECDDINQTIERFKPQLSNVVSESDKVEQELRQSCFLIDTLKILLDVSSFFTSFDYALSQNDFYNAAQILDKAKSKLSELSVDVTEYLDLYKAFKLDLTVKTERLRFELGKMWSKMFIWNCDGDLGVYKLSIRITDDGDSREEARLFFKTVALLNILDQHFKPFKSNLMNFVVKQILTKTVKLKVSRENAYVAIEFSELSREKPDAGSVFKNFQTLFSELDNCFLNINVSLPYQNVEVPLAYVLGKMMSDEFCHALISEGLLDWKSMSSSGSLTSIAEHATNLQNQLVDMKFLDCSANVFGNTQNFNSIISNKMCQDIFKQARIIMKKDIHRTTLLKFDRLSDTSNCELNQSHIKRLFEFPECAVSEFMIELVDQIRRVCDEAVCGNVSTSSQLYFAARYVCELFCDIVPIFHQHSIEMFPQQTAIHHNNCAYLAHELLFFTSSFKSSFNANKTTDVFVSFADLSHKLKTIGTTAFLAQMRRQKQQLLEFLQEGSVFRNLTMIPDFLPKATKALQQCVHQLNSLRQLWVTVLPCDVYLKAVGTLCNSVVEEIIFQVSSQEDITEIVTEHLGSLFEILLKEIPPLFRVDKYKDISDMSLCQKYVVRWAKFQELKWLIVSSLRDIVDRWSEGAGPLAVVFTPEEVKQLIRALFQNTERRSVALAKIVAPK